MTTRRPRKLDFALDELGFASKRVLDLACGPGEHLQHFGHGSLGIDHDAAALATLAERGLPHASRDLNGAGWSVGLARFEAAWLCDCLVHVVDPGVVLDELSRVLQPNAIVAVVEWIAPRGWLGRAASNAYPGARAHFAHPEHLHRFDDASVPALLERSGLQLERIVVHGLPASARRAPLLPLLARRLVPPRTYVAHVG